MTETVSDLEKRDTEDINRSISPLKIPEGALVIDNTNLSLDETMKLIKESLELQ